MTSHGSSDCWDVTYDPWLLLGDPCGAASPFSAKSLERHGATGEALDEVPRRPISDAGDGEAPTPGSWLWPRIWIGTAQCFGLEKHSTVLTQIVVRYSQRPEKIQQLTVDWKNKSPLSDFFFPYPALQHKQSAPVTNASPAPVLYSSRSIHVHTIHQFHDSCEISAVSAKCSSRENLRCYDCLHDPPQKSSKIQA